MRDDLAYLQHIAAAISDIEKYTAGGEQEFFDRKIIQDAVMRNLEIIGEAVKNIRPETRLQYPEIPWKQIAGYWGTDHVFGMNGQW